MSPPINIIPIHNYSISNLCCRSTTCFVSFGKLCLQQRQLKKWSLNLRNQINNRSIVHIYILRATRFIAISYSLSASLARHQAARKLEQRDKLKSCDATSSSLSLSRYSISLPHSGAPLFSKQSKLIAANLYKLNFLSTTQLTIWIAPLLGSRK